MTYELDLTGAVDAAARRACIEGAARQAPEGHQQAAREGAGHAWDTGVVPAIVKHELRELVTPLVHAASRPLAAQGWDHCVTYVAGTGPTATNWTAENPYRDAEPDPLDTALHPHTETVADRIVVEAEDGIREHMGAAGTLHWHEGLVPIRWHIPGTWFDTVGNQWRYIDGDWRVRVAPGGTWVIASALGYGNDGYFPMHRVEQ